MSSSSRAASGSVTLSSSLSISLSFASERASLASTIPTTRLEIFARTSGAKLAWVGNSSVGSGSQEIIKSVPDGRIVNALDFSGSQAKATFRLTPDGNGTRVTWSLDSEHGYNPINRLFGALLLDGMVGEDYEKGLAKLKGVLESGPR